MPPPTQTAVPPHPRHTPAVRRCQVVIGGAGEAVRSPNVSVVAALLILGWVALNLAYLLVGCPLDLSPDEAHYWQWSRRLDWSYYSKGPLVAWLIRGSCELFGDTMPAVRLPAVLCGGALLAGLYVLAADALRSPRAGLATVALAMTLPPVHAASALMTIDPPFLACWCWALVGVGRAVARGGVGWWLLAGGCSAVGVLAKYPMLLLPVAVAGYLLADRPAEVRRRGFWLFAGLTATGLVPVVVWNAGHDWVSVRHVARQAGGEAVRVWGPAAFVAGQAGVLLGFWLVAFVAAGWRFRRTGGSRLSLLWWAAVPVWLLFLVTSLRTAGQPNWPAAAYVGGLVLCVAWLRETRRSGPWLAVAVVVGLAVSLVARYPGLVRPVLAAVAGPPTAADPTPVRKLDPTARLRGWRTLAAEVDRIRDRVTAETGADPALAGMTWTTPGELAFYCRGRPPAYSFGLALGDRHSQHDLWRPNPVADAQAFRGRSFVYVGDEIPDMAAVFDRVEPPVRVVHTEQETPVAVWTVWVCHGFRGFPGVRRAGY